MWWLKLHSGCVSGSSSIRLASPSFVMLTAMRSYVVTEQIGWRLLSSCCRHISSQLRSDSHQICLPIDPSAFAPDRRFCTSFNTKDYMIENSVAIRRTSAYFQRDVLCEWPLSAPTTYSWSLLFESFGKLKLVLALSGLGCS